MLYRVVRRIAVGEEFIEAGTVGQLPQLSGKAKQVLQERGALAEVAAPPLEILPGWKARAKRLGPLGITNAGQLVELDERGLDALAKEMHVGRATLVGWQQQARSWLTIESGPPGRG